MNFNSVKRIIFILLGIFVLSEVLFLIFPKIINVNSYKKEISEISKDFIDTEFSFDEMTIKTYPDFSFKINAKNAKLENIANIESLEFKASLLKLFLGKLSIKKLKLDSSNINVIVFKDNTTNLDKILQPNWFSLDLKKSTIINR